MSDRFQYAFADDLIPAVLRGEKTATVRVDDERTPEPGDAVAATNDDGREFATLRVTASLRVKACRAHDMVEAFHADHAADSPNEMLDILNQHYDRGVSNADPVHVLIFEVADDDS